MNISPHTMYRIALAAAAVVLGWPDRGTVAQDFAPASNDSKDFTDVVQPVATESARAIGQRIAQRTSQNVPAKPLRIAVFPFGNSEGKITQEGQEMAFKAQGAITFALGQALAKEHKGKFAILDKFALARELNDAGIDPASISADNPDLPGLLKQVNVGVAVLGQTVYDPGDFSAGILGGMRIKSRLVFADDTGAAGALVVTPKPSPPADEMSSERSNSSNRLGLQIWRRTGDTYEPIPIVTGPAEGEHAGVLYAIVPAGSEGTEFSLRLSNRGVPDERAFQLLTGIVNSDYQREHRRLYGVVLTIDGVNSFYQDLGDGERKPVVVHPRNAHKWILSPPGFKIAPASNKAGYELQRTQGAGHSIIDVRGFQTGDEHAQAFTFSPASQSVAAEKVGLTEEIGVITAYFFPEKLPGDGERHAYVPGQIPQIGAAAGRQVLQPVVRIGAKFHKEPATVLRIFYRSANDCPIPQRQRVQIAGRK